eukprot:TRINITY_DN111664_c0_g1_i1.p1 TRINITY_DN111664_c0_g1~~TRINITY_DN111664_c0_g1_i1.p1  ORF type:complete len:341 (+),score=92.54 TRINITY_DN111664_c0_g1_i1:35-1024(+)
MGEPPAKRLKVQGISTHELLLPPHFKQDIAWFLKQDIPNFDVGGFVVGTEEAKAVLMAKTDGILAGVPFFNAVFEELGCKVKWDVDEGCLVGPAQIKDSAGKVAAKSDREGEFDANDTHFKGRHRIAEVTGPCYRVLQGERTALNILSRCSGIASETRKLVDIKNQHEWHGEIACTRKLTPGFRLMEKYAVIVGGGSPHRMDLSDMTMLKDNHVWACGNDIKAMVQKARRACGFSNKIEVECQKVSEARCAANAGAEIVMLDNFPPEEAKKAAKELKAEFPRGLTIEVSGGLDDKSAAGYFSPEVDVLSFGSLTHGYGVLDFSLKIDQT